MKRIGKCLLIAGWVIAASFTFTAIWLQTPAFWFINLPEPGWDFLTKLSGATGCESVANLEVIVGLSWGAFIALIFVGLFFLVGAILRRRKRQDSE